MFIKKKMVERYEFINESGDTIGYAQLSINTHVDGSKYAIIDVSMPNYDEYTVLQNVEEAKMFFNRDIEEYLKNKPHNK